jgi:hypothetical protein
MASRSSALKWIVGLAPVLVGGCNAIFGIEPAASGSVGSAGGGTSTSSATSTSTSTSTASAGTGGATTGATTSAGTSGTGGAAPCPADRVQACDGTGGACAPHLLDGTLNDALRLAVNGDFVYVSTDDGIHRERYDGTAGLDFGAVPGGLQGFAIVQDHVYWATYSSNVVSSSLLDGTGSQILAKLPTGTIGDSRLTASPGFVYWTSYTPHAIWRAATDGSEQQNPLAVVSENLPALKVTSPFGVAADDTYLYWTDADGVRRMALSEIGTQAAKILDFAVDPTTPVTEMLVDAGRVYWISTFGDVRSKATSAAPGDQPLIHQGPQDDAPVQLAVDATHVYWIAESGAVSRAKKTGGAVELVVAAPSPPLQTWPRGLAVDCGAVYWTSPHPTMAVKGMLWKAATGP